MPEDKKTFIGGMNQDFEDRLLPQGDYRYALNCRMGTSKSGNIGAIENVNGTTLKYVTLPPGYSKCIGAYYSNTRNSIIYFLWNDYGHHTIYEFSIYDETITIILQNRRLNFDYRFLITGIDIIDNLLFWTDNFNPPRKINIAKAISHSKDLIGGYSNILRAGTRYQKEEFLDVIKYPPPFPPTYKYYSDDKYYGSTGIEEDVFQFKYRWIYDDGEKSAWSPASEILLHSLKAHTIEGDIMFSVSSQRDIADTNPNIISGTAAEVDRGKTWPEINDGAVHPWAAGTFDFTEDGNYPWGNKSATFKETLNFPCDSGGVNISAVPSNLPTTSISLYNVGGQIYDPTTGKVTIQKTALYDFTFDTDISIKPPSDGDGFPLPQIKYYKRPRGWTRRFSPPPEYATGGLTFANWVIDEPDSPITTSSSAPTWKYTLGNRFRSNWTHATTTTNGNPCGNSGGYGNCCPGNSGYDCIKYSHWINSYKAAPTMGSHGQLSWEFTNWVTSRCESSTANKTAAWVAFTNNPGCCSWHMAEGTRNEYPHSILIRELDGSRTNPHTDSYYKGTLVEDDTCGIWFKYYEFLGVPVQNTNQKAKVDIKLIKEDANGNKTILDSIDYDTEYIGPISLSVNNESCQSGDKIYLSSESKAVINGHTTDTATRNVKEKWGSFDVIFSKSIFKGKANLVGGQGAPLSNYFVKNNVLKLQVNTGSELVEKIDIAVRNMEYGPDPDWYYVDTIDKISSNLSNYNLTTYNFHNQIQAKRYLNPARSNKLYDFVPRLAKSQVILGNNRLAYGNILEGFIPAIRSIKQERLDYLPNDNYPGWRTKVWCWPEPSPSRYPITSATYWYHPAYSAYYSFVWGNDNCADDIHSGSGSSPVLHSAGTFGPNTVSPHSGVKWFENMSGLDTPSHGGDHIGKTDDELNFIQGKAPVTKRGGKYRYGIVYFDRGGRSSMVNTNQDMEIQVPFQHEPLARYSGSWISAKNPWESGDWDEYGQSFVSAMPVKLNAQINHRPPKWATHFQWVMTKDLTQSWFVQGVTGHSQGDHEKMKEGSFGFTENGISYGDDFRYYIEHLGGSGNPDPSTKYDPDQEPVHRLEAITRTDLGIAKIHSVEVNITNFMEYNEKVFNEHSPSAINYAGALGVAPGDRFRFIAILNDGDRSLDPDIGTTTGNWRGYNPYPCYLDYEIIEVNYDQNCPGAEWWVRLKGDFTVLGKTGPIANNPDITGSTVSYVQGGQNGDGSGFGPGMFKGATQITTGFFQPNTIFEIYRKKANTDEETVPFYEFGEAYDIGLPHTNYRYHKGESDFHTGYNKDQKNTHSDTSLQVGADVDNYDKPAQFTFGVEYQDLEGNPEGSLPGIGNHWYNHSAPWNTQMCYGRQIVPSKGDIWYRTRIIKESAATAKKKSKWRNRYFEDPHPYDWSHIDEITSGHGRAHFVNDDLTQNRLFSTVRWSEPKIPNTGVNNLNEFYESPIPEEYIGSGFHDYDRTFGHIQKMIMRETDLIVLHEDKVARVLVGKEVLKGLGTAGNIGISTNILALEQAYLGDYGVDYNPESVAQFGNSIYFVDIKRGKVLKLSEKGLISISDKFMSTYFNQKSIDLIRSGGTTHIVGVFDTEFSEYIINYGATIMPGTLPVHYLYGDLDGDNLVEGNSAGVYAARLRAPLTGKTEQPIATTRAS